MPFQLSPGVAVVEKDFSSIVPAVSSSIGAFAGTFGWGPILDPITISSENRLVEQFGTPNDSNFQSFFSAANFLSYTNNLLLVRADSTLGKNAVSTKTGGVTAVTIGAAGSAYTSTATHTVAFSAPEDASGTTATGTVTISGGAVSTIAVTTGGTGYSSGSTVLVTTASGDAGTGASGEVVQSSGVITSITVTGGSGYKIAPTVAIVKAATVTPTGTGVSSESTIVVSSFSGIYAGMTVSGTGVGSSCKVSATPTTTTVTVTVANSGTVSGVITFTDAGASGVLGAVVLGASTVTAVAIVSAGSGYTAAPTVTITAVGAGSGATATSTITLAGVKIKNNDHYVASFSTGGGSTGEFAAKYAGSLGNSLKVAYCDSINFTGWTYESEFDSAPSTSAYAASVGSTFDELHVIVVDEDGLWTGTPGTVLEKYAFVSKALGAVKPDGTGNHYKNVINTNSLYIWWTDYPTTGTDWGTTAVGNAAFVNLSSAFSSSLSGGVDDYAMTAGQQQTAYALFSNAELYDISLVIAGKATAATAKIIADMAQTRADCVAFISPQSISSGDAIVGNSSTETDAIIAYRNALNVIHSYAVIDSGFKYQYDRYNDVYRYITLNADIAGLCARTDYTNDPWWSPGGYNRGQIKNVVRLAHNPDKTNRDSLYKAGVNPVVSFPGQGIILFGDKTTQTKPSAFDRINVRRLFIVLEKAIAIAAKFQLFEFNDPFTRAQFANLVEPFLREVQGRRGITDFRVKCDETNNTGQVIDSNEFVADIFIKPNRSINYITLNFVAARSSANFTEIGG